MTGLTRSNSPVFPFYPPDRSGRRPSARSELQYTSPHDRAADPTRRLAEEQGNEIYNEDGPNRGSADGRLTPHQVQCPVSQRQTATHHRSSHRSGHEPSQVSSQYGSSQISDDRSFNTYGSNQYSSIQQSQQVVTQPRSHTTFENSDGGSFRPPPPDPYVWYCVEPGCGYRGPYLKALYSNCALGCEAPRRRY